MIGLQFQHLLKPGNRLLCPLQLPKAQTQLIGQIGIPGSPLQRRQIVPNRLIEDPLGLPQIPQSGLSLHLFGIQLDGPLQDAQGPFSLTPSPQ